MSVKWEKQEGNVGKLTFEIEQEKVKEGLDRAFVKVRKTLNVPGFRKGKVPRQIFNQRFGEEALFQDALDILLPEVYSAAIDEAGIDPVDTPQVNIESMEKGETWVLTAEVTVKPEVKLGDYKGLEVEKRETELTTEELEAELKQLQERQAELVVKEDAPAENGDTVILDFEGFKDGVAFEGGQAENHSLELGSGQFIPGFEEKLVGLKAGDEADIELTFPEEYHAEDLAGQPVVFKVKLHEIKTKEVPALDDELAKDIDEEVETLDELKEKISKRLQEAKEESVAQAKQEEVIAKAVENAEVDIPHAMVHHEADHLMNHFAQDLQAQGLTPELYYQFTGQTEEAMHAQMEKDAEKRVKMNLVLEAIAEAENIEPTEEAIDEEISTLAEKYGMEKDAVRAALGDMSELKSDLKIRKAIDVLLDSAVEK
ncbi:trigger factor [Listeria monocytogenes]|jgi:trigger factor|uniref:Trigger factor n=12 Tax=Listeria monocytogenes TaxID=1639 RepID=TIG_LISMO|nr:MULTISPECIES: trigger factor [Listeria]NP_464792.1 trigger factor [Listeria monocytogenes EGD-e]C1L2H5.1 RecName: Full=Trigger factor; Short=TF; AltName: Full=PPIase [Listeria monocytogenes serotype 4b str. CLIP 80459]Q720F5.1 RecName: Full=Trigger factor; Short=TF; AltName: Full=PPIase [Listeria monocytogenes serotype 4b str. F2365]Q8Y7L0.1 RecName: Full=Trigger factor; Short=TF; AltName: Full=PPIase [Listeria monocytogenes EGD-e]EAA0165926.1 trigger factor [Listeria monocytogenes serotype